MPCRHRSGCRRPCARPGRRVGALPAWPASWRTSGAASSPGPAAARTAVGPLPYGSASRTRDGIFDGSLPSACGSLARPFPTPWGGRCTSLRGPSATRPRRCGGSGSAPRGAAGCPGCSASGNSSLRPVDTRPLTTSVGALLARFRGVHAGVRARSGSLAPVVRVVPRHRARGSHHTLTAISGPGAGVVGVRGARRGRGPPYPPSGSLRISAGAAGRLESRPSPTARELSPRPSAAGTTPPPPPPQTHLRGEGGGGAKRRRLGDVW